MTTTPDAAEAVRAALKPFAETANDWHEDEPDSTTLEEMGSAIDHLNLGHLRAAAKALAALERGEGEAEPACTDCGGSGVTSQTERRCACQPPPPASGGVPSREAKRHAVELEQCALFVDSEPLKRAMTDAAKFLRSSLLPAAPPREEIARAILASHQTNPALTTWNGALKIADSVRALYPAAPSSCGGEGWLPIESCPTDMAAEVDLKLPDGTECVGMFSWPSGTWRRWTGDVPSPTSEDQAMRVFAPLPIDVYPTHWRPRSAAHAHPQQASADSEQEGFGLGRTQERASPLGGDGVVAPSTAQTWRPIETAPRDGTEILIWHGEGAGCEVASWADKEEDGPDQPGHDAGWIGHSFAFPGRSWGQRLRSEPQGQPTHWMPILHPAEGQPTPPSDGEGGAQAEPTAPNSSPNSEQVIAELRACVSGFRRKLATYVSVYPGDKELRKLLDKSDAALRNANRGAGR